MAKRAEIPANPRDRERLVERFFSSEAGKRAAREEQSEIEARRTQLVEQRKQTLAERDRALPALRDRHRKATERVDDLRRQLKEAQNEAAKVDLAIMEKKAGADRAVGRIDREMEETAPAILDDFLSELRRREDQLRGYAGTPRTVVENGKRVEYDPTAGLAEALDTFRDLIQRVEALKLEALTHDELEKRIAGLRATIPTPKTKRRVIGKA